MPEAQKLPPDVSVGTRNLTGPSAYASSSAMYGSATDYFRLVAANFTSLADMSPVVDQAASLLTEAIRNGRKIMFCGNGGSAADSQHLAAELTGRYLKDRAPIPALALTVDSSALTAIANDYGYDDVFARQVRGIGQHGDVLIALSTSGNSESVLRAVKAAQELGISTVGLSGRTGGKLKGLCDLAICVPADQPNHIQEMHIAIGHYLCGFIENAVC
jgi:D-sedoheptulose 7-phosphate isomerase